MERSNVPANGRSWRCAAGGRATYSTPAWRRALGGQRRRRRHPPPPRAVKDDGDGAVSHSGAGRPPLGGGVSPLRRGCAEQRRRLRRSQSPPPQLHTSRPTTDRRDPGPWRWGSGRRLVAAPACSLFVRWLFLSARRCGLLHQKNRRIQCSSRGRSLQRGRQVPPARPLRRRPGLAPALSPLNCRTCDVATAAAVAVGVAVDDAV